jgi:hypothetical protein
MHFNKKTFCGLLLALFLNLQNPMNRLKKILKISGIVLLSLILILSVAPFLFKGKILAAMKKTTNEQLNAKVDFSNDIHLSFLRNFPNVSLGIDQLSVVGIDSFAGDTLVYFPELRLKLDVMSVLKGEEISIKSVKLTQPKIYIETLRSGRANWDIVKTDTSAVDTSTGGSFKMALDALNIEDGRLVYNDRSLDFYTELNHFNHNSKGDFSSNEFTMVTHTETPSMILGYGGVNWLYKIKTAIDADIKMNLDSMKFSYEKAAAKLNELAIESDGFVDLNDNDIDMDIEFKALENSFKNFLSLVPGVYTESFKDVKTTGSLALAGSLKGKMTDTKMPATAVKLEVTDASFQYPGLAYGADRIFINLAYTNPDGAPDNSVLNLDRLMARVAGEVFNLRLFLKTPVSDPYIDATAKGKLDLSRILGLIPMDKGTKLAGLIDADIAAKGNYSSVTHQNFGALDAKGILNIKNFLYQTPTDKDAYLIDDLALNFTPQHVDVNACKGAIGKNDFDVKGSVQNMLGYAFANEKLTGNVSFNSNYINVNSLVGDAPTAEEPKPTDTAQLTIVELPSNIDMALQTSIKKLIYDNYILTDAGGTAHLHDAQIDMKGLSAGLLGGRVTLNGTYDSKNVKSPFTSLETKLEKMNFASSFSYFPMLARYAPVAKYIDGIFNASIDMSSILNQYMQPNYESMNVKGMLSFTDAAVKNLDVVKEIGRQLNVNWLEKIELKNQQVKFEIKEGIFKLLDSLTIPLAQGASMRLAGQTKLNRTVAYGGWIKIPRKALGAGNKALDGWIKQAGTKGWNLNVEEMIPVDLGVTGDLLKPKVNVSLKGFAQSTAQSLKEQGKEKLTDEAAKKREQALAAAQGQADKLKAEAAKRAEQVRQEGKVAADRVRAETKKGGDAIRSQGDAAYDRIMAETETTAKAAESRVAMPALKKAAGDKVRSEGKKKAESAKGEFYLEDEANKKAVEIEEKANEEADTLLREAEEKSKI